MSEQQIRELINEVADEVIEHAADDQVTDAVNLVVNAFVHRLFTDRDADLHEVIEANYDASPQTVLAWVSGQE